MTANIASATMMSRMAVTTAAVAAWPTPAALRSACNPRQQPASPMSSAVVGGSVSAKLWKRFMVAARSVDKPALRQSKPQPSLDAVVEEALATGLVLGRGGFDASNLRAAELRDTIAEIKSKM